MSKKRRWLTAWIPHRLELLLSPAWGTAPRPLKNLLERIEIEHLRHGGLRNGELYVAYTEFVKHGISRRSIKHVLEVGQALGLLEVVYAEQTYGQIRPPNAYRLTYVPRAGKDTPSDEWKSVSREQAERIVQEYRTNELKASRATRKEAA